jgi:asparagine synthetase B (glutamine-hydrolysing)
VSAIAAVLHLDGRPVVAELVARLTKAMAANGPDRDDVWVGGAVGLGCASFYTVPEQLDEPMPLIAGTRALVLDGRIDNRAELHRDCAAHGVIVSEDAGDGAYVIAAYDAWGVDAPAHLVGEWAFVLWDRAEERLLAARDHMARRSLRWWSDGRTLIVSSQFPGILEHPDVRAEPNEGVVAEWLAGNPATIDETLWAGIRNVPGGRQLVCTRAGRPQVRRYWDPAGEREDPITGVAEAADAMRSAVAEAVRAHLRCTGIPEIEVSGGWDSSTVALVANELHLGSGFDFQLSSALFPDDPPSDESPYIEAMERHLRRASLKRPLQLSPFDALTEAMDESRHPWRRDDWRTVRPSSTHRVTLTGDGGNETLGGMFPSGPAMLADAFLTRRPRPVTTRKLLAGIVRPHVRPSLPRRIRVARSVPPGAWVDRDLSRRTSLVQRFVDAEGTDRSTTLRRIGLLSWLNSWTVHQSYDLSGELDRGRYVELRNPLQDVRLVRLALRLPARVTGSPHTNARHLHRCTYGPSLPALVTQRTMGVGFEWVRVREIRRLIDGLGEPRRLREAGWVDDRRYGELIERSLHGTSEYWPVSLMYAVELWLRSETR